MDLHKQLSLLLLVLLTSVGAWAEPNVSIGTGSIKLTDFPMAYHVDASEARTYEQVRTLPFLDTGSRTTLGTAAKVTWFRLIINNVTDAERRVFVHLPHAYHVRSVDFFEERNGTLLRQERLDLNDAGASDLLYRGTAVYPLTLLPDQPTVLYLRSHSFSHQWFAAEILDEQTSRRALISVNADIALMVGMLLALVFYNGLLYFATSKKENMFYSLYLISGLVWIALSYGLIASMFDVYGIQAFKLNISLITMPVFLVLFMMAIFDTRTAYRTEHRFLQGLIVLLTGTLIWGLFDISAALKPSSSLAALVMVVTFSVSISLYRKGNPLVKYFLVGHTFFVVFNGIAVLFYKGLIAPNYLNSHGVGIGIVLEALTLAFIISHRIKILEDIRSSQEELKRQASTDPLTRLYNRRFFFAEADYLLELAKDMDTPVSLLVLDVDHFKSVNDRHGHACGDKVLVALAQSLKQHSRADDLVARFGGEEFVLLLPGADLVEASICAERIRAACAALDVRIGTDELIRITASIGCAQIDAGHESIESALSRADRALYEAKNAGRNCISVDVPEPGPLGIRVRSAPPAPPCPVTPV
ncbi:diguanylate cyclase [Halopseudomonas xinjiangensis]|uniref:diguanylate cyclase n=1 Tax=Halopseudomonas xinjiangensis TaxID=487184 RepID=A0A1H1T1R0_9GAMM|nr:diguanylate cyclase [Halopseudomonas xinjiangensis]SDS54170.1 diguanylate cyclase [Halopseudomonas xinjiangensis]